MSDDTPTGLLVAHLADCETGWSMGTFGAIAEFTRDRDEAVSCADPHLSMASVTPRGGIRLQPHARQRLIASESLTKDSWSQRVALCLPRNICAMNQRAAFAELGPDREALRSEDQGGILFDLGLSCLQVDVCVRIPDAATAQALRRGIGQPVFAPGSLILPLLMAANPHRVFLTRLGRLEVFQPIPPPDGRSPDGPHTHILPKLLASARTHAATEPLPDGWIPCAHFYPAHPLRDLLGGDHAFRPEWHEAFQALLVRYGDPDHVALKQDVAARIDAGAAPSGPEALAGRFARATVRIALRQMQAAGHASATLQDWLTRHDPHGLNDAVDPMEQMH